MFSRFADRRDHEMEVETSFHSLQKGFLEIVLHYFQKSFGYPKLQAPEKHQASFQRPFRVEGESSWKRWPAFVGVRRDGCANMNR
jgi:hypothetical protein